MRIGGFPTDSVTEDYLVTLRLKEIGYRTVYLNERADPRPRARGPQGIHHAARPLVPRLHADRARAQRAAFDCDRSLAFIDRLSLIDAFLNWAAVYPAKLLGLIVPILYLLFGIKAVHADLLDAAALFPAVLHLALA